jgi:hypothetical protein
VDIDSFSLAKLCQDYEQNRRPSKGRMAFVLATISIFSLQSRSCRLPDEIYEPESIFYNPGSPAFMQKTLIKDCLFTPNKRLQLPRHSAKLYFFLGSLSNTHLGGAVNLQLSDPFNASNCFACPALSASASCNCALSLLMTSSIAGQRSALGIAAAIYMIVGSMRLKGI